MLFYLLKDILIYGAFFLFFLLVSIFAFVFGTLTFGQSVLFILLPAIVLGLLIVRIIQKLDDRPDFYTSQMVGIKTNGCQEITYGRVNRFVEWYIQNCYRYVPSATPEKLKEILYLSNIIFVHSWILGIYKGKVTKCYGMQVGSTSIIYWQGSLVQSALFHEWHHVLERHVLGIEHDYYHENKDWWQLVEQMKVDYFNHLKSMGEIE